MSSTQAAAVSTASGSPDSKAKIQLHPVPVLDTPLAKGVSLGRVATLLALLAIRMNALIADPVSTLQSALPVVAAIQVAYAAVCLPVAGSPLAKGAKKARPGERKKADASGANPISSAIISLVFTALTIPALHILFVLFGAPFLDHIAHTTLCAAHFALLGVFPVIYARGIDQQALVAIAGAAAPLDESFGALLGAVVGAWLGAVPIPLDWDREWQKWPITIVVATYAGSLLGSLVAGTLLYGKRLAGQATKAD